MAVSLSSSFSASVRWAYTSSQTWGDVTDAAGYSYSKSMTTGTASGQADRIYVSDTTLAASGTVSIDLAGSLTDVFGNTITMARVKVIYFQLLDTTSASSMKIGGASSNGFANWITSAGTFATDQPQVVVRNPGIFLLGCSDGTGYAVTAGTADILKLTNVDSSNTATYRIVIIGASA